MSYHITLIYTDGSTYAPGKFDGDTPLDAVRNAARRYPLACGFNVRNPGRPTGQLYGRQEEFAIIDDVNLRA